jgi:hypothetical protein
METVLHRFNPWWTGKFEFPGIPRKKYISKLLAFKRTNDVVLVTGLRRVGKTTIFRQIIHALLEEVDRNKIFYVSLDHMSLARHTILDVVEQFRKISGLKHDDFAYLFLDEVHFKDDFELQLKNLYDEGNAKIFASGSASLDIVMKSPHLTGRQRLVRVSPLDFGEYLAFTGKEISSADRHLYPGLVGEYMEIGGMPEYVKTRDANVLQALLDSILYRDIAARHDMRNSANLRDILSLAARSVGSPISMRKISRVLGIPVETVGKILELFVEAGLIHLVEKEGKASERKASPRKIYIADNGLLSVLTERVNRGALAENLAYLRLRDRGIVRYRRTSGLEVDFVVGRNAWEVKYRDSIGEDDLANIGKFGGRKTVLTRDAEGDRNGIRLQPMWKLLLDEGD